jgi:hypothetical protein
MACPLAFLVLATAAAQAASPTIHHAEAAAPDGMPAAVASGDDVARLCAALVPAERLRAAGDAIARGELEARHEAAREEALARRYRATVPGAALRFEAYDPGGGELALDDRALLSAAGGAARIWIAEEAGLPVEVAPDAAKRLLDAQARGTLSLALVFELPEDAACGGAAGARTFTLAAEPVAWRYLDGDVPLAGGGEDAGRALGVKDARPRVEIGAPLQGSADARAAVAGRSAELERCYADALARSPGLDGVLVARVGGDAGIAADSVGDPGLADCVRRALGPVGGDGAVPIRFELVAGAAPAR